MISAFISSSSWALIRAKLPADVEKYYRDLFARNEIRVFYSFGPLGLKYEAYYGLEYGRCTMGIQGSLICEDNPLSYALAFYVRDMDQSSEEPWLRHLYGSDYDTLSALVQIGPKKAKSFFEVSKRIDDLAYRVGKQIKAGRSLKPSVRFLLDMDGGKAHVSMRIGFTKFYVNRKMGSFLRDYYAGQPMTIQKEHVTLPQNSFPPNIEKAFQFLYNSIAWSLYFSPNYPIVLSEEKTVQFLFLLQGEEVECNDTALMVSPAQSVALKLDEKGSLKSSLPLDIKGLRLSGSQGYVVTPERIDLYEFASSSAAELYTFYRSNNAFDPSFLAAELAKKVLPLLHESDLEIDEEFAKAHPIRRPHIDYYVSLEENNDLTFDTKFLLGEDEIDETTFAQMSSETAHRLEEFKNELERLKFPLRGQRRGEENVVLFLSTDLLALRSYANVYVSEELQKRHVASSPSVGIRAVSGEDWFSVSLYASGYSEEDLLKIYAAFTRKKKFVRLKETYVLLDHDNPSLRQLSEAFGPESIGKQLPLYQALKLPSLGGETDSAIKGLIDSVQNYGSIEIASLPKPIAKDIRGYQRTGIQFFYNLYQLGLSGILSDDMGLGKTLQSFGLFSLIEDDGPILVVSPKSLIYNWMEERNKWYPKLPAHILVGNPKERHEIYERMKKKGKAVYFVSYDTLRNDIDEVQDVEFSLVMLDEGQYISNANALKTRAVKQIKAKSRFVLTGTPIQNSLMDLWSIFDFLLPGYFPSLNHFKEIYGGLTFESDEARSRLRAKIKPFLLGRKKKDVLQELPDKENVTIALGMNDDQLKVYESYLARAKMLLQEGTGSRMNLLAALTRMRQICISPSLVLEGEFSSAKIDYLIEALTGLKQAGRKAIVFSSFVGALEMIGKACKEIGINPEFITGETSAKVRVILAERFNKPDSTIDVMLVSLKAGGTGLNLIGADTVFHLDPWWNLAAERQAEDRAHRIGQTNKVTVFKLVLKHTVEETMLELQKKKGYLIDMADEASLEGALTEEDYRFLLS